MLKSSGEVLNSIKTTNLLLWALIFFFVAGALCMPGNKAFETLQSVNLFEWMASVPLNVSWWIFGSIVVLVLLVINTVFCSVTSLFKKKERKNPALILAPQVVHAGFCFLMLAHLISSTGSSRQVEVFYEGKKLVLPSGNEILMKKIKYKVLHGRAVDPSADISVVHNDGMKEDATISLNDPVFVDGTGVYIKNVFFDREISVLIEFAKDPGAVWALIGSILFSFGTALFFFLKIKYEVSDSLPRTEDPGSAL